MLNEWTTKYLVCPCSVLCTHVHTRSRVICLASFPSEDALARYLCFFSYQDHSGICTGDFSFFSHFPLLQPGVEFQAQAD